MSSNYGENRKETNPNPNYRGGSSSRGTTGNRGQRGTPGYRGNRGGKPGDTNRPYPGDREGDYPRRPKYPNTRRYDNDDVDPAIVSSSTSFTDDAIMPSSHKEETKETPRTTPRL